MSSVISFEERAVVQLRRRLGAAEEANQDLIAFARGHSGAAASIHTAVLAAIDADGFEALLHVVTQEWPSILGLDAVALAMVIGNEGFRVDASGVQAVAPQIISGATHENGGLMMRNVGRGHPLFGSGSALIRSEVLVRIDGEPPLPTGLLLLGQQEAQSLDSRHGSELMMFLARSFAAIMRRWLTS